MSSSIGTVIAERAGSYDVVVAGGGPAGFAAALSARREGARVLLVESQGCLGGVGTSAAVVCWLGAAKKEPGGPRWVVGGVFREMYDRLLERGGCYEIGRDVGGLGLGMHILFDIEEAKLLHDDMVREAGVDLRYFSTVVAPELEEGRVAGLYLAGKDGLHYVEARVVVDCTGDADVAHRAGCATVKGRSETGLMTAGTVISIVEDVDPRPIAAYLASGGDRRFRPLVRELRDKGVWKWDEETIITVPTNRPGVYLVNTNRQVGVDGTDARSLTQAMLDGRRQAHEFLQTVLRPYYPGFSRARMRQTGATVGIRETRKIVGEYTLTDEDVMEGRDFPDTVALSAYGFDLPDPKRPSLQPYSGEFWGKEVKMRDGITRIPYRCLVPLGSRNLLVAGRCVSVKDLALGPIRVMPPCYAMGQAAGVAAAMCAARGSASGRLDPGAIRRCLVGHGAIVG